MAQIEMFLEDEIHPIDIVVNILQNIMNGNLIE